MGDNEAARLVGRLVRECGERAYQFAYRLTGNAEESRDLVQESYRRVLARWRQYDPKQPLEHWFFAILRNLFLDAAKRYERRHAVSLDAPVCGVDGDASCLADLLPGEEEAVLDALERQESARAVREALESLTVVERAVLTMCDVEGMSYAAIAGVLGCPLGTVRSRISRARAALKARLLAREEVAA